VGVQFRQDRTPSLEEAAPVAGADFAYAPLPFLTLDGGYRYWRYDDTWAESYEEEWAHTGRLAATTYFNFLEINPLRDSSIRTYGEIDVLNENYVYDASQEINIVLYRIPEPETTFTLLGTAVWEDSQSRGGEEYFSPDRVLSLSGGARISSWIGVSDNTVLGLTGRATYGQQIERLGQSDSVTNSKIDVSLDGELGVGEGLVWLGTQLTRTGENVFELNPGDYWSVALRLGFVARLPRLLAP
jgi:hypothetical protein